MIKKIVIMSVCLSGVGLWGQEVPIQAIANMARKGSLPPENIKANMLILLPAEAMHHEELDKSSETEQDDLTARPHLINDFQRLGIRSMIAEGKALSFQILEEFKGLEYQSPEFANPALTPRVEMPVAVTLTENTESLITNESPTDIPVGEKESEYNQSVNLAMKSEASASKMKRTELSQVIRPKFQESNLIPRAAKEIDPRYLPSAGPSIRKIIPQETKQTNIKIGSPLLSSQDLKAEYGMARPVYSNRSGEGRAEDPILDMIRPETTGWNKVHHSRVELNGRSDLRPDHPSLGEKRVTPARFMDLPESIFQEDSTAILQPEDFEEDGAGYESSEFVSEHQPEDIRPNHVPKASWRSEPGVGRRAKRNPSEVSNQTRQVVSRRRRGRKLL